MYTCAQGLSVVVIITHTTHKIVASITPHGHPNRGHAARVGAGAWEAAAEARCGDDTGCARAYRQKPICLHRQVAQSRNAALLKHNA
eukprot:1156151-Pelagomonas_calceolata.AAC.6